MAAGIATIKHLIEHEAELYPQLELTTRNIAEGVAKLAQEAGVPLTANRVGSMFTWFFAAGPVTDFTSPSASDIAAFRASTGTCWRPGSGCRRASSRPHSSARHTVRLRSS